MRARHLDSSGRASHWSPAIDCLAPTPDLAPYRDGLRISEIMYHPKDGFPEFIELHNISTKAIDLTPLTFTAGIDFAFTNATISKLNPNERLVIANDSENFIERYPDQQSQLAGRFSDGKLSNGGERLTLSHGKNAPIHTIHYDDEAPWPSKADGRGYSLVLKPGAPQETPSSWSASSEVNGTPGG